MKARPRRRRGGQEPVRWAVLGLGHIAQIAVLPAFAHARRNSRLVALVSGDRHKLRTLQRRHDVEHAGDYGALEQVLEDAGVDAVYVAAPNHLHEEFTTRALRAGVHVLCEKPLAVTSAECGRMIAAARTHRRLLMTAYRLHFAEPHLEAIRRVTSGELGDVTHVHGTLTLFVRDHDNIRLGPRSRGGGPLYDLGVYCVNAARYLLRSEPQEACALASPARRRGGAEAQIHGVLRFPRHRFLSFSASVVSAPVSELRVVGTKGELRLENAFDYAEPMRLVVTRGDGDKVQNIAFAKRDQFAAQLVYFADCIRRGREPEPSGIEGLADVRIVEALHRSADTGRAVRLPPFRKRRRPDRRQAVHLPAVVQPPPHVHANAPSRATQK